jgi:hypothetical protein
LPTLITPDSRRTAYRDGRAFVASDARPLPPTTLLWWCSKTGTRTRWRNRIGKGVEV